MSLPRHLNVCPSLFRPTPGGVRQKDAVISLETSPSEGQRSTYRDGADVSAPPKKSCTVPVFPRGVRAGALLADTTEDVDGAGGNGTALEAVAEEEDESADATARVSEFEVAIVSARASVFDSHVIEEVDVDNETSNSTPFSVKDAVHEAWSERSVLVPADVRAIAGVSASEGLTDSGSSVDGVALHATCSVVNEDVARLSGSGAK